MQNGINIRVREKEKLYSEWGWKTILQVKWGLVLEMSILIEFISWVTTDIFTLRVRPLSMQSFLKFLAENLEYSSFYSPGKTQPLQPPIVAGWVEYW